MSDAPGADCFRTAQEYKTIARGRGANAVDEALSADTSDAVDELERSEGDVDEAGLMEAFAKHAHGGDLRDSSAWSAAAVGGRLPAAWTDAVDEVVGL